jgi:CheY-like chemotaxis protein
MGHAVLGRKIALVVNGALGRNRLVYFERNPSGYGRIMIVEDNSMLRLTIAVALAADGLEILSAANGIDGRMLYEDHAGKFDAIVTDNEMPKMDGLEFVRCVRDKGEDCRDILLKLLLERAGPYRIGRSYPVVTAILGYSFSGGSRMYLSRTISHAVSWACWGVYPCLRKSRMASSISSFVFSSAS